MIVRSLSLATIAIVAVTSTANAATISLTRLGPTLVASTNAGCKNPEDTAKMIDPMPVEIPELARLEHNASSGYGVTTVEVDLNENGSLEQSLIASTSGDAILDKAALNVVRTSKFSAERHGCKAIAGAYAVRVDFDGDLQ